MQLYQPTITGSLSVSGSINLSGSITLAGGGTISGTASIATNAITASSADNFLVRNTLTAQTLVVQTITSSVDFVTGSTRFGSIAANTHTFTGSVLISGSSVRISGNQVDYILNTTSSTQYSRLSFEESGSDKAQVQYINSSFSEGGRAGRLEICNASSGGQGIAFVSALGSFNTPQMLITPSGSVGIGTITPNSKFHIDSTSGDGIYISSFQTTTGAINTGASLFFGFNDGVGPRDGGNIRVLKENGTSGNYSTYMSFSTRANLGAVTERIRIASGGNVGIGTTNTPTRFNIQASANFETATLGTATGTMGCLSADGLYGMYVGVGNSGNTWLQSQRNDSNTASYDILLNPQGGNVGIATTSPRSRLDVSGGIMTLYLASTIANKSAGLFCQSTSLGLTSGFGFLIQDGFSFQGDNIGNNRKLSVRKPTADGSLGDIVAHIDSAAGNSYFAGRMERPNQPAFQVNRGTSSNQITNNGAETLLEFNNVVYDTSSSYNTSTFRFTAPVAGCYLFTCTARYDNTSVSNQYIRTYFSVNGASGIGASFNYGHEIKGPGYSTAYESGTISAVLRLAAGDFVSVRGGVNGGTTGLQFESQFSGFLI